MFKILSVFLLLFLNIRFAEPGEAILKNLQNKFDKVNDLSAEFKQTTNGKAALTGKFYFKKDDKLRIELKNSTLISDGATNWSCNLKENKVIISNNDENSASPFSLKKVIYDYPKECSLKSEKEGSDNILILEPPKNSSIGYSLIKIWTTKDNLINRIILTDNADNKIQIDFSKYKLNQKLSDSRFSFTPPEGCKVIDLR